MASTTFTSSSDHHLHHLPPSSSSHRPSPPVPVRSVLRPKTSASTITTTSSANLAVEPQRHRPRPLDMQSGSTTTTTLERPATSPSPRQSYFERYPTRNGKGKEKTANDQGATTGAPADHHPHSLASKSSIDGMASARAKAARERAKALNSRLSAAHSDQEGPSAAASSSKTPSPAGVAVAFPTVDDPSSHDDADVDEDPHHGGGATTSSSTAAAAPTLGNDYGSRRPRQISEASSSSNNPVRIVSAGVHRGHHREKSSGGHYRPTITTNNTGAGGAYPSRPPREHLPRSQAYHHLSNFPTQSSSSRGIAPTPDLLPFIRTSTSSTYTQTTLADQDPEFTTPLSTPKSSLYRADGVLVAGWSNGVGVETMDALVQGMNGGADATDDTDYLTSMFGRRPGSKKDKRGASSLAGAGLLGTGGTKLKYHPLYHPPLPQPPDGISLGTPKVKSKKEGSTTEDDRSAPSNPASASVSSSEREKERERRPRKVSGSGQTPFPSGSHHHRPATAKSDITIKHGSRSASGPFDDVEVPTRKAHSRPSTREKDRDRPRSSRHRERVRGSRDYHHHHRKQHEASSSNSSPREETRDLPIDLSSPQPTPVLEKPPEAPKPPTVVPSISDIIRTHAPGYAARPKRSNGPAHPPSSFTGFVGAAPVTTSRRSSLVEEDEEPAGRSSIDSIAAEVQESLRKSSTTRFASASGRMEQQSRESSDDYDEAGSRRVSLASPTQSHSKRPFPVVSRKTLQHAKSFGDRPRSVVVVSETPVLSSANSYRSPKSEGGAHSVIGIGIGGPPRPASRSASVYSGPAPSLAPSTPLSLGTPGITFTGGNTATQDPTKLELAQFLRSPRLTRLMTLRRHPHAGLTVSMADVGSPNGHPVIVYLGLGCVRYLIALYDEMAEALGLRLVCVDRWGLGRTGEPTTENGRGLLEWAAVIEEVADTLGLEMYSVIAHSAGAPYSLAGVLKCGDRRLKGSVHLLAPWVSMSVDTGYKWLKYVPNGLIKTAQAAEWKVQGWMLGKPPTITYQGIEYDAAAAAAAEKQQEQEEPQDNALQRTLSPPNDVRSSASTSSYDDLGDFDGKYESCSTLGRRAGARNQPVSSTKSSKKKPVKSILSIFNNNPHSASSSVRDGSSSKANSTRSSRANSLAGGSSVKTLPGPGLKKSPKLKGLKSLSSLRTEASMAEVTRHSSDPMLSTGLEHQRRPPLPSHLSQPEVPSSSAPPNVTVGLGIGMDDEMMEWGARLNMLEEISPPTPPSSMNGRKTSGATGGGSSESGRGRRSVSLTGGRPAFLKDIVPPVPPLPTSPCLSVEHPHSPNTSITSSTGTGSTAVAPRKAPMSLANALLRASHAESLKGGTADLLAILERDSKPWGFSYADVKHPVKVWYGDRDEKIAISSVRWMERVMRDCTVTIVKGANHNLMTNADVVVEVLESIAKEWSEDQPVSPTGPRPPLVSASTSSLPRKKGRY
ncbi:hypothetical protein FRC04_008756 [Tulasnella sp. 424]|nr:hypothetical protein FRC04_008756 [Tulasnella sp. 424]KAG8979986.1 hypothetical protein FRC05_007429 [Tulasnella sp. 425]